MQVARCDKRRPARQAGVGLIEVLIAVLVFAVGVLGLAAVQLSAKRSSYEATQRSIATSLSRDILERMRSNPAALDAYVFDELDPGSVPAGPNCVINACDPNDLAAYDLDDWTNLLSGASEQVTIDGSTTNAGGLVESRACITNDSGNITVTIVWRGVSELADDPAVTCAAGTGLYDAVAAGDNLLRRRMIMTTYVAAP